MDLRALKYFVAAVEGGSITAAGEACHVAQPSITLAISKLEDELGVKLLQRQRNGVTPTAEGKELYQQAVALLNQSQAILTHFSRKQPRPSLKIHVGPTLSVERMRFILKYLQAWQTDYHLEFTNDTDDSDIQVCLREQIPANFHYEKLWSDEYCVLLPCDHPLTLQKTIKVDDLIRYEMIERSFCSYSSLWQQFIDTLPKPPRIVAHSNSEEWA